MPNVLAAKLGATHPNGNVKWHELRRAMLEFTPYMIAERFPRIEHDILVAVDGAVPKHCMGTGLCEWSCVGGSWDVTYRRGKTSEPGDWTNNDAEMAAMFEALTRYSEPIADTGMKPFGDKKILILSDSQFIVNLLHERSAFVSEKFFAATREAKDILRHNQNITVKWIPGELNVVADALSRGLLPLE